jgi:hypothetical protein
VLIGYAVTAAALVCGLPVLGIGVLAAQHCRAEGFACLGRIIYGKFGGALVAAVACVLLGLRLRLGIWWGLITVVAVSLPLVLIPYPWNIAVALPVPALAALVTRPRTVG